MPILLASLLAGLAVIPPAAPAPIQINDNLNTAGRLDGTVLAVSLVASTGAWRPKGPDSPPLEVAAFGEEGGSLTVPGPLIRVTQGTTVALTLRNTLATDLRVIGFCTRPGPCDPMTVASGGSRDVRISMNVPGTYYYWASSSSSTLTSRPRRESQLGGAIVVDAAGTAARDRVMVISIFDDGRPAGQCATPDDGAVFAINGASWPYTPRLHYEAGEAVRWRIVNLSCDQHMMHLHGFHFTVESAGDGSVDRQLPKAMQRTEVTEPLQPGRTFTMTWTPTRAGNWLFHCHMIVHMAARPASAHVDHGPDMKAAGMAGLVVGVEVTGSKASPTVETRPPRRLRLLLQEEANRYGNRKGFRMEVEGADAPRLDPGAVPGPVIVLERGEPAEITVSNQMSEPTAIHWHGMEIESYFDGVPGFGGMAGSISPPVEAGQSFVATLTPPRAGTFIYHTHWHDESQLAGGMYGPLIVLEPGERYDPQTDHIVIIGLNGVLRRDEREPFALNGRSAPSPIRMRAGVPNRLRLINITANNPGLIAFLMDQHEVAQWRPVAKDGAALPPAQTEVRAARQPIGVGETYDFEIAATGPRNLWLEVRRGSGEWVLQAPVEIR